jgi:hypothetical protein
VLFALCLGFFIYWQFIRRHGEAQPAGPRRVRPSGPQMAVPKSRVRG